MGFRDAGSIRYHVFDSLQRAGVSQAIFTRRGGVSQAPYASLNVGSTVGDDPEQVSNNRQLSFAALGRSLETLFDVWQVHGTDAICAEAPRPLPVPHQKADIILTDRSGVTLFMRFADCVPIFLVDPCRGVVGLAHAGWQGTVKGVAGAAVRAMQEHYGSRPADLLAGIGPSICPEHYVVGPDVVEQVQRAFGTAAPSLLPASQDEHGQRVVHFDLWGANALALDQAGVGSVETARVCTACQLADWYSHRAEKGRTGRFGALLAL